MRFYIEMEEAVLAKLPFLKSKLESLSCSSSEVSVRKNYSIRPETHVLRVSVTDKVNGNKPTFYIYFADSGESVKASIENQYSYLYESFDRRNYALEHLLESILNEWCSTSFNGGACER